HALVGRESAVRPRLARGILHPSRVSDSAAVRGVPRDRGGAGTGGCVACGDSRDRRVRALRAQLLSERPERRMVHRALLVPRRRGALLPAVACAAGLRASSRAARRGHARDCRRSLASGRVSRCANTRRFILRTHRHSARRAHVGVLDRDPRVRASCVAHAVAQAPGVRAACACVRRVRALVAAARHDVAGAHRATRAARHRAPSEDVRRSDARHRGHAMDRRAVIQSLPVAAAFSDAARYARAGPRNASALAREHRRRVRRGIVELLPRRASVDGGWPPTRCAASESMTRSRFAGWNFASALLFAIVTMVVGVFATPWLLQWLGEDRFGAYKAVIDWFGYLALLDFGILGAMQPLFAEALGKSDTSAMGLLVATGSRLYARVVGVMIVVGLIITSMITHLIPVPAPLTGELRIASLIVVAGLLLLPLSAPFRIVLESDQRGYRVNNLLVVQSLATTALSLGFAYYGGGIAGQALAVLIASLPYHLRLLTYGRRRFPREMRDAAAATPADAATARARLLSLNRPTFVLNLCGRVGLLSDNIVIAALLGPAAVVPFFATQRIAVMVQGQLQSLGNATWA